MTGSLQTKNNIYYIVLNTYENGKRKQKWINTELPVKGNKTKAQKLLRETLKEYEKAEKYANQAITLEPTRSEPRLLLAEIYFAQNRDEETELVLLSLIAQDPGYADAYGLLIELYDENNDFAAIKRLMDNCTAEAVH